MSRYVNSVPQIIDENGKPIVGAKKFLFEPSTVIKKDIYSDSGFNVPIANPVLSDSAGRFPAIFLDGIYDEEQQDNSGTPTGYDGVTIWTRDNIGDFEEGQWSLWVNDDVYNIPDFVLASDDEYYRSIVDSNQGNDPTISPAFWELVKVIGIWNTNVTYSLNDIVIDNGVFFTSTTNGNIGNDPSAGGAFWSSGVVSVQDFADSLTKLIDVDQSKDLRYLSDQGFNNITHNQNWGGIVYDQLPLEKIGEVRAGNQKGESRREFAKSAFNEAVSTSFEVPKDMSVASVWVAIHKEGNSLSDLQLLISSDNSGTPLGVIGNGTATPVSNKKITNEGINWIEFTFPVHPALTANTLYHIVLSSSAAVDAANYWWWEADISSHYPFASSSYFDGAVWNPSLGISGKFLVVTDSGILQSGLSNFNGALNFYEDAKVGQSGYGVFPNVDFNHQRGTLNFSGTGWNKDKTFFDSGFGTDNNRIVIRCEATGFAKVELYADDQTAYSITGTIDLSAGDHTVSVVYLAEGAGNDYLKLYVDGALDGTPLLSQTIVLDRVFKNHGNSILGGGFGFAPTWTYDMNTSVLPSADGWTYLGSETEGDAWYTDGILLHQNGSNISNSYHYNRVTTFSNAVGVTVEYVARIPASAREAQVILQIQDGTKNMILILEADRLIAQSASPLVSFQYNASEFATIRYIMKGEDFYIYINNDLVVDGTNRLASGTATNSILLGSTSGFANDEYGIIKSFKYFEGAHFPEGSTLSLSEFAYWERDQSELLPAIYNSNSIQPVKKLSGRLPKLEEIKPLFRGALVEIPNQPVPNNTTTYLTLGAVTYNTEVGGIDFTVPTRGLIVPPDIFFARVTMYINWQTGTTGIRSIHISKNVNVGYEGQVFSRHDAASQGVRQTITSGIFPVVPNDSIQPQALQSQGIDLNAAGSISVEWIS